MIMKTKTRTISIVEQKQRFLKFLFGIAVVAIVTVGAPVRAQVPPGAIEVWPTDTLETIQTAVNAGGIVYFHPGTYNWTGILNVSNSVELAGPKPTGGFNTKTGIDNRVWEVKITKSPTGIWDTMDSIIRINCPGSTENVIISNLDTECLSLGMCILLQGGGSSVRIANCRIKTIDDGYGFVTWQADNVSVVIENCYLEAGTAGFLYPDGTPPNTDCIVFGMSKNARVDVRNNIAVNWCETTDTSTAMEVVWHQNPNTQMSISNNWLQSAGKGFAVFYGEGACPIGTFIHNTVVGNRHFLHFMNSVSGGIIKHNRFECGGDVSVYFQNSSDVTVQRNLFVGNVSAAAIGLYGDSSNNVLIANDLSALNAGTAQILIEAECQDNMFTRNVIGSLGSGASAGIQCYGDRNSFIRNDYTQSGIPGLAAGSIPCIWFANSYDPDTGALIAEPENNLVFEVDGLPPETTATEQILDDPHEQTGTTTNIVVGL